VLTTSFAVRSGVIDASFPGSVASIPNFVASNAIISRPRNPFVFARCFPWRSTQYTVQWKLDPQDESDYSDSLLGKRADAGLSLTVADLSHVVNDDYRAFPLRTPISDHAR